MAKIIPLTQGQVTIVDDEDFNTCNARKWCAQWHPNTKSFYAVRNKSGGVRGTVLLHRVIMAAQEGEITDHRNHDTLDNRRSNLRNASHSQNGANRKGVQVNNSSGYRGVTWNKEKNKWAAQLYVNKKRIFVGYFDNLQNAVMAVMSARIKYFGEFAGADR